MSAFPESGRSITPESGQIIGRFRPEAATYPWITTKLIAGVIVHQNLTAWPYEYVDVVPLQHIATYRISTVIPFITTLIVSQVGTEHVI